MERLYSRVDLSVSADFSKERFEDSLYDLDFTSSPGYPYMKHATTIGQWLKFEDGKFDRVQVERLWYDVQLVMAGQYEHFFRCFVKDEVHKVSKRDSNRWRLIMASSLPVQVAWRLCFAEQNAALNKGCWSSPSTHGMVLCYGGWRRFKSLIRSQGICQFRDLQSWDIFAPGWALDLVKIFRKRLANSSDSWNGLVDLLYDDAFRNSKIMFSNGTILKQQYPGLMKSGLYNTITDNSLAMVAIHLMATLRSGALLKPLIATGDDVAHGLEPQRYFDEMMGLGVVVKEVTSASEFMGTDFSQWPRPMYLSKHIYNVCCAEGSLEEVLESYAHLYAHSPWFDLWAAMANQVNYRLKTREYYQFWYDSPMAR